MKILCVDDDKLALSSLEMLLDEHEITTFTSPLDAIQHYLKNEFDIILLDIRMQELNGIETAKRIRNINPDAKIILLSTFIEPDIIKELIQLKLNGYLLKVNPECILESLKTVYNGQIVLHNEILPNLSFNKKITLPKELTPIELNILELVAKGYNNQEISDKLNYSLGTIRNYISNILEILNVRDRTQLVVYYYNGKIY